MLGKLLKHEFRATGRILLPLLAAELLLAFFAGLSMRGLNSLHGGGLLRAMYMLTVFAFFLALFAVGIVAVVLMIQRFYKNLLQDEGYLSMTLPVSVDEHIWAKLIVSFVCFAAVGLLSVISMLLVLHIGSEVPMFDMGFAITEGLPVDFGELGALHGVLFALEFLLASFLWTSMICLRCYTAMAIGCSAADHKLLLSFVAYFVIGIALSVLRNALFFGVLPNVNLSGFVTGSFLSQMGAALVHGAMWTVILALAVYCAAFYFVTRWFLKNKLNLA